MSIGTEANSAMTHRFIEPVKFLAVGVINTIVGLGSILLLKLGLGFGDVAANFCGYQIGVAVSFVLNRSWTFRHTGPVWPALFRFLTVYATAYTVNLATVLGAIHWLHIDANIAQAVGIAPYTVTFFLGSRFIAFRQARRP